jgi:DNA modification methylase
MKPVELPIEAIIVGDRIRKDMGDIADLANSIQEHGIIQPLVINEQKELLAGGRRYAAAQHLGLKTVPVVLKETEGSEIKLRMIELEENIRRKEMTWKEMVHSVAEVHAIRVRTAALEGDSWSRKMTGKFLNISEGNVNYCVIMNDCLKDPNHPVQKAESLMEAFRILTQMKEDEAVKVESAFAKDIQTTSQGFQTPGAVLSIDALIERVNLETGKVPEAVVGVPRDGHGKPLPRPSMVVELSKYFVHGDCLVDMHNMAPESVDHIVTDSPYGIDMSNLEQNTGHMDMTRVEEEHDVERNLILMKQFFPFAYKVIRDKGFCVVWYDLQHHNTLINWAEAAGFKACRWPLVWVKTHRCKNEAANYNFTKATEVALVLRKGNATLVQPQGVNYWVGSNDEEKLKYGHPFVKPEALWRWILSAIAVKNQIIYDPFAGVGSGILTAARAGYFPRATEINELHYNNLIVAYKELIKSWYQQSHDLVFI